MHDHNTYSSVSGDYNLRLVLLPRILRAGTILKRNIMHVCHHLEREIWSLQRGNKSAKRSDGDFRHYLLEERLRLLKEVVSLCPRSVVSLSPEVLGHRKIFLSLLATLLARVVLPSKSTSMFERKGVQVTATTREDPNTYRNLTKNRNMCAL